MVVDFAAARRTMVDRQIHTVDVTDHAVLSAFAEIPREAFFPPMLHGLVYSDADLPLPGEEHRLAVPPATLARLIQLAAVGPQDKVLVVGAASGYGAAVLSRLAGSVIALEEDAALAGLSRQVLSQLAPPVTVVLGPLAAGHPAVAPYDVILLEGAVPQVPSALIDQLQHDGRLVAIVGDGLAAAATLFVRSADGVSGRSAFNAPAPRLPGFDRPRTFSF